MTAAKLINRFAGRLRAALLTVGWVAVAGIGGLGLQFSATAQARPLSVAHGATAKQAKLILSCLSRVGLSHVSASSNALWTAWYPVANDFVYVYMYPSKAAAAARAHAMSAEEVAPANQFLVVEPTARYSGSPVPEVADCLLGKPFKKAPTKKHKGTFTF